MMLSVVSMAIWSHFFIAHDFWDYDNAERFSLSVDEYAILKNLKLIDEFTEDK